MSGKLLRHHLLLAGAVLILTLVCFFAGAQLLSRAYEEELRFAAYVLSSEEAPPDAGLFKGEPPLTLEEARAVWDAAGYAGGTETVFYGRYCKRLLALAVCCFLGCGIFWLFLFLRCRRLVRAVRSDAERLENALLSIREGSFQGTFAFPFFVDEERGRVAAQLGALNDFCALVRSQARRDSDRTRALITDISHQLKTPAAALDACFSILEQEDLSPGERAEFMERCKSSLQGFQDLLAALTQISRLETGMITLKPQAAPVFDTILAAVSEIYPRAAQKEIEIEVGGFEEIERLVLRHDARWMKEVFVNVLDNAVKYSPLHSTIRLTAEKRVSSLRFEISDEGAGIKKEDYHRIFQRFYRGSSHDVQKTEGSGVGLYLARRILSMHQGTISVRSRGIPGGGSTFIIHLPYRAAGASRIPESISKL